MREQAESSEQLQQPDLTTREAAEWLRTHYLEKLSSQVKREKEWVDREQAGTEQTIIDLSESAKGEVDPEKKKAIYLCLLDIERILQIYKDYSQEVNRVSGNLEICSHRLTMKMIRDEMRALVLGRSTLRWNLRQIATETGVDLQG